MLWHAWNPSTPRQREVDLKSGSTPSPSAPKTDRQTLHQNVVFKALCIVQKSYRSFPKYSCTIRKPQHTFQKQNISLQDPPPTHTHKAGWRERTSTACNHGPALNSQGATDPHALHRCSLWNQSNQSCERQSRWNRF